MPNFQIPNTTKIEETDNPNVGRYVITPLERGYGITIGNTLRRILLSSIPGASITNVRIEGVLHEFSTLKGINEDVSEIILNLKKVRLKLNDNHPDKVHVKLEGPAKVTAGLLAEKTEQFEVLNPDLVIATLNTNSKIDMEITIGRGRGYRPSELNKYPDMPVGCVAIDSIFSPIVNVNYRVEKLPAAEKEGMEKITLDVETDGSVSPNEGVAYAARLMVDHLKVFNVLDVSLIEEPAEQIDEESIRIRKELTRNIDDLELSVRSYNCLQTAGIKTLADLVKYEENAMLKFRNFGRKSLAELNDKLTELGLHFKMDVSKYLDDVEE